MSTPFGGFGSAAEQKSALAAAIIGARIDNPQNFKNVASNYLNGLIANGTLTNTQVQSIAPTVFINPQGKGTLNYLANALAGYKNPPTNPGTDNASNTSSNNDMNNSKDLGHAATIGLAQIQSYLTSHPLGLLVVGGLLLFVVLRPK